MSDYSILFDVAKVHQADVAREAELVRISKEVKHDQKTLKQIVQLLKLDRLRKNNA